MARSIVRLLLGDIPAWTRRENPALRQELGAASKLPISVRFGRALTVVFGAFVLLGVGYLIATNLLAHPAGQTLSETVSAVVFFPLIALQIITSIVALTSTSTVVADAMRRQSWDSLRATEEGAAYALRARWVAVFYRLRGLVGVIIAVRVVLIALLLFDLTAFQGRYLDLLINGITPDVSIFVTILLVALMMTAGLLLPLTSIGFDAAVGLLIAALVQQRTFSTLVQALLIVLRLFVMLLLLSAATQFLSGSMLNWSDGALWVLMTVYSAVGDWGLALLYLGRSSEIWAIIPYGILISVALVGFAPVQAALADRLLIIAARQAQKKG